MKILKNIAAYFQTEVPQEDHIDELFVPYLNKTVQVYHSDLTQRSKSAVVIQKWWRGVVDLRKRNTNIIK